MPNNIYYVGENHGVDIKVLHLCKKQKKKSSPICGHDSCLAAILIETFSTQQIIQQIIKTTLLTTPFSLGVMITHSEKKN